MFSLTANPAVLIIADDDEDSRDMFRTLMSMRGHRVLEARDGHECLELARRGEAQLVVLDLRMPGLDGFAVAERLRAEDRTAGLALLAVTALADGDARDRALACGCDEVLVKPLPPRELLECVEALLVRAGTVGR
jgi:DNA-binding response OmpR family regulator